MIVTVFRSRLREGVREEEEYVALANRINALARTITGYVSHKEFYANDGERVAVVEFAHEEGQRASSFMRLVSATYSSRTPSLRRERDTVTIMIMLLDLLGCA